MLVIAQALVLILKCQPGGCSLSDLPLAVQNAVAVSVELCEITILQIDKRVCHRAECPDIGPGKVFTNANTEYQWTAVPRYDDVIRSLAVNDGQRIGTLELR